MMYIWKSVALKNYADGYIIVEASNVDQARTLALMEFTSVFDERFPHLIVFDEDDQKERDEKFAEFIEDLDDEPEIRKCVLISGSD